MKFIAVICALAATAMAQYTPPPPAYTPPTTCAYPGAPGCPPTPPAYPVPTPPPCAYPGAPGCTPAYPATPAQPPVPAALYADQCGAAAQAAQCGKSMFAKKCHFAVNAATCTNCTNASNATPGSPLAIQVEVLTGFVFKFEGLVSSTNPAIAAGIATINDFFALFNSPLCKTDATGVADPLNCNAGGSVGTTCVPFQIGGVDGVCRPLVPPPSNP